MPSHSQTVPYETAYEWLGGEPRVRELVTRFYDLMDLEPKFSALRTTHAIGLDDAREKLYLFLTGWLGGPALYIEKHGHPRLRQRHLPFKIGVLERNQWVACMAQAMREIHVPEELYERLLESFYNTAEWMRNQPDAVEGEAQMPQLGVTSKVKDKLQQILSQYGIAGQGGGV
ncbi:hemoglobin [Hydromonas duriensis]|uniref:Hemoglobin n=1 Tax=Hydromonas duriensis TaxID=1527608 RepID=A0A4R6Y9P6_9BURK|nr:hemoglobin [Hydromonas duriensis]